MIPILSAFLLALPGPTDLPASFEGEVIALADGDTFTILRTLPDGRKAQVEIRPHKVDCPESYQAYGNRAKDFTADLIFRKVVRVTRAQKSDSHDRMVARVELPDGRVLNDELVRAGFAWVDPRYARGDKALYRLEDEARRAKRGLWADLDTAKPPIPPWEFRKHGAAEAYTGPVIGHRTSKAYHHPGCHGLPATKNQVAFKARAEADAAGYHRCRTCLKGP